MDRAIAADEFVYQQYLIRFKKLLNDLNDETMIGISNKVKEELRAISQNQEAAKASLFLGKQPFQLEEAEKEIQISLDFIIQRRNALVRELK